MKKLVFLTLLSLFYQIHIFSMDSLPGTLNTLGTNLHTLAQLLGEGYEKPIILEKPIMETALFEEEECPIIKGEKQIEENILKTVENVKQLKANTSDNAQATSGYISAYYALESLARTLKKPVTISFEDFKTTAERLVKKYRIRMAARTLIEQRLLEGLVSKDGIKNIKLAQNSWNTEDKKEYLRTVYRHFIGDVANIQAQKFVKTKYNNEDDTLIDTDFIIKGTQVFDEIKNTLVGRRTEQFKKELQKEGQQAISAFFNTIINQQSNLTLFTEIDKNSFIQISPDDVLLQLHKNKSFDIEEGRGGKAMPKGLYLRSDDIEGLIKKCFLKSFGLTEKDIHLHVFDDLNLENIHTSELSETLQNKQETNQVLLASLAEQKNVTHIFVVNNAFNYENPNALVNTFNWIMILRTPSGKYIVADPENEDITESKEIKIIKKAFGDK